jgi:TrpR-related protein YerC/YecD
MKLSTALKNINSDNDIESFLKDLCTPSEIQAMEERWEVAKLLFKGKLTYREIASELGTSTATVTRVARFLYKESNKGYLKVLKKGY